VSITSLHDSEALSSGVAVRRPVQADSHPVGGAGPAPKPREGARLRRSRAGLTRPGRVALESGRVAEASGGVGGRASHLEPPPETPLPREAIAPWAAVPGPESRNWCRKVGISVYDQEVESLTRLRGHMRSILSRVRRGKGMATVWDAVSYCGRVVPQAGVGEGGELAGARLVRHTCGLHKVCPRCARAKSREDAAMLRRWVESREEAAHLVATVTQKLKARRREGCDLALDRMMESFHRLQRGTKPKHEPDREAYPERWARYWWRTCFTGGHRSVEITCRTKGEDGARFSGFHVHAHLVLECARPPDWWVVQAFPGQGVTAEDEGVRAEWQAVCMEKVWECWRIVSPIHEKQQSERKPWKGTGFIQDNVHVDVADRNRIYQACKYATKPATFKPEELEAEAELEDHADSKLWALVEMFTAVQHRKLQSAWGTWRCWRKEVQGLVPEVAAAELEEEEEAEMVEFEGDEDDVLVGDDGVVEWRPLYGDLQTLVLLAEKGAAIEARPRKDRPLVSWGAAELLEHLERRVRTRPRGGGDEILVSSPMKSSGYVPPY